MKNNQTTTETWEQEFVDMLTKAYWELDEHDLREAWITKKSIDFIKELIAKIEKEVRRQGDTSDYPEWKGAAGINVGLIPKEKVIAYLQKLAHSQEEREGK